jgi:F-type H+-transporting ATPase subunit a
LIFDKLLIPMLTATEQAAHTVADTLGTAAGHAAEQAGSHAEESHELPNIIHMLDKVVGGVFGDLYRWENIAFAFLAGIFMCVVAMMVYRRREMVPGSFQNVVELIVETLYNFFYGILGENTRRYTPFLGTLFIYILIMNWMGIVPFLKAPTSAAVIPISLAIVVFFYSQAVGFRRLGVLGWLHHLAGEPEDIVGWVLVPLMIPIHVIGEIAKPVSLGLRLFGNITGEDILVAAFTMIGVMALSIFGKGTPVGIPFQIPFYLLGLLMSAIQALVFAALATIYIALMLPHEHERESH